MEERAEGIDPVPSPLRLGPRPLPRPDPRAGVFETLLISGGAPVGLDAHLARMAHSTRVLYGCDPPTGLAAEMREAAAGSEVARMRVDCAPAGAALTTSIAVTALALPRPPVALAAVVVPGGLGCHKWADRRLIDALARQTAPALPLICDLDGLVLEGWRSNVFVREPSGALVTPPLDGRILPGTVRAETIARARAEGAEVREEALAVSRLAEADEVFVTGSLGGIEPVTGIAIR
jgi:para-aminobenzoate synthetase/4-amino-4-deoxychorismate lyase